MGRWRRHWGRYAVVLGALQQAAVICFTLRGRSVRVKPMLNVGPAVPAT
jgi:hypothetical protein